MRKDKSDLERECCAQLRALSIAGPVILTMKNVFFREFLLKHYLLRTCFLGLSELVLIKSEILIMTGMVWPVSSDKRKAPLLPYSARNWTFSLRASSPIWLSEASRSRTRRRAAKPRGTAPRFRVSSRISSRVPLVRLIFSISPPKGVLARRLLDI